MPAAIRRFTLEVITIGKQKLKEAPKKKQAKDDEE